LSFKARECISVCREVGALKERSVPVSVMAAPRFCIQKPSNSDDNLIPFCQSKVFPEYMGGIVDEEAKHCSLKYVQLQLGIWESAEAVDADAEQVLSYAGEWVL
jgi:hypothetical protein